MIEQILVAAIVDQAGLTHHTQFCTTQVCQILVWHASGVLNAVQASNVSNVFDAGPVERVERDDELALSHRVNGNTSSLVVNLSHQSSDMVELAGHFADHDFGRPQMNPALAVARCRDAAQVLRTRSTTNRT